MKLIKLKVFILMLFLLTLTACNKTNESNEINETNEKKEVNINDVVEILDKYKDMSNIDLDYSINYNDYLINTHMVVKTKNEDKFACFEITEGEKKSILYYINGYLYSQIYEEYQITDFYNDNLFKQVPMDFDFSSLEYQLNGVHSSNAITYEVNLAGNSLKEIIENIIGNEIDQDNISMKLEIVVKPKSNEIKTMKINAKFNQSNIDKNLDMVININKMGEVELNIPSLINDNVQLYINQNKVPDDRTNLYINTSDGAVNYYKLGLYKTVLYDKTTKKLVVLKENYIDVYNAETMRFDYRLNSIDKPFNIDVDNGRLAVSYKTKAVRIYDLDRYNDFQTYTTRGNAAEIALDGDIIIYNDKDNVYFDNISTNEYVTKFDVYKSLFNINRKDHLLYLVETNLTSCRVMFFYTQTGKLIYNLKDEFSMNKNPMIFDGKYLHINKESYNAANAASLNSMLNRNYSSIDGLKPYITLYDSTTLAFVSSIANDKTVGIYDNINEKFVYKFSFVYGAINEMDNGKFIASGDKQYIAIIDVNKVDKGLVTDEFEYDPIGTINTTNDGNLNTLVSNSYTKSIVDNQYIYTIHKSSKVLNVYRIDSLEKVHTEYFSDVPATLDAYNGRLVVTFGYKKYMRIYDISTWDYEIVKTDEFVFYALLYKNQILYVNSDQHSTVKKYDLTTKTHTKTTIYGYGLNMDINRENGILYVGSINGNVGDMIFYNIDEDKIIFSKPILDNRDPIFYDGYYVHYSFYMFDSKTGDQLTDSWVAVRNYKNFDVWRTSVKYDDGSICIFSLIKNGEYITVVYDIKNDSVLLQFCGQSTYANRIGDNIVIMSNYNKIRTFKIS